MAWRLLADLVLIIHLLFILFVLFGGLLYLHRSRWAMVHLPAVAWGIWIEWVGGICPLTPLENHFRLQADSGGYSGSFVEHYLVPLLYPQHWDMSMQWLAGSMVVVVNLLVYLAGFCGKRKTRSRVDE